MAEPLKIARSLDTVTTGYTVFERDQVLTEKQLNGLASYLDDQTRLSRVELSGVGIMGGLRVRIATGNKVAISRGVGVTTDGDLLVLPADASFDRIKPYDQAAPQYPPFFSGSTMLSIFELVREGESDVRAQGMSTLPGMLSDRVVLMLMESCQKDPDLCTGTDCDNLGKNAVNTTRFLLVNRADAAALLGVLEPNSKASRSLAIIRADRPQIAGSLAATLALGALYRASCDNIYAQLTDRLPQLFSKLPGLVADLLTGDPSVAWLAKLATHDSKFPSAALGIQYYYDFLKDLAETWNALREALFDDDCVLCPDVAAFPKHLLLGDLASPLSSRTGLYPSPLTAKGRNSGEQARFLVWRLHTLINCFGVPAINGKAAVITPSRSELAPLENRAIPYYYFVDANLPIHRAWNYRLTARGAEGENYGYRANEYGGSDAAKAPFASQIGFADFFRVEGHLGQNINTVVTQLEAAIATANVPIFVRSALLDTEIARIKHRPPIRFGDLHRLHYLIRKDVDMQLDRAAAFGSAFKDEVTRAVDAKEVPATLTQGNSAKQAANDFMIKFAPSVQQSRQPLSAPTYAGYRADNTLKTSYNTVLDTAGKFRESFGHYARTDFVTSVDHLVANNQVHWLDWLDTLIDHKDRQQDTRLLFQNFIKEHPGVEHCAGVSRGGTLVLVYDPSGAVLADFSLPYAIIEEPQDEPTLPTLPIFTYKPAFVYTGGFKLIEPIDVKFNTELSIFAENLKSQWTADINIQKDYFQFFKDGVSTFTSILAGKDITGINVDRGYTDAVLAGVMRDIQSKQQQLEWFGDIAGDPQNSSEMREQAKRKALQLENELGESIRQGTEYVSTKGLHVGSYTDGSKAMNVLTAAAGKLTTSDVRKSVQAGLGNIKDDKSGAVGSLLKIFG